MKSVTGLAILAIAFLPLLSNAEPFWCPPGRDKAGTHPMSFESLAPQLQGIELEVNKLIFLRQALNRHVDSLGSAGDAASVRAFEDLVRRILNRQDNDFLSTSFFDFDSLFGFGIAQASCDIAPNDLRQSRPALYAVYEASEAAFLIGRSISMASHAQIAEFLSSTDAEYNAWLITDGLPQWPWELWLNGKQVSNDILEPAPLTQWIVARPSVGIDLTYPSQENADVVPSFALEVFGFVRYRDRSYKKHIGVSLLTTIGSEDGAGYGLALRWNGFWAGYVLKEGDRADALYLGFDLAKVLKNEDERSKLAEDFNEELLTLIRGSAQ